MNPGCSIISTFTLALICALALATGAFAQDEWYDPLADLKQASFVTSHDVSAHLPHGDFTINDGIVAMFPGLGRRLTGMFVGDCDLEINALPRGEDVLNLHEELTGKRVLHFKVSKAFLSASINSDAWVEPTGYSTAVRTWDELTEEERALFSETYLQCYSDGWVESSGSYGGYGGYGAALYEDAPPLQARTPRDKEVYAAMWTEDDIRWDYKVDASGETLLMEKYYEGTTYVKYPWNPELWEADRNVDVIEALYSWSGDFDELSYFTTASVNFTVKETAKDIYFISPWSADYNISIQSNGREIPTANIDNGMESGHSWLLTIEAENQFVAGEEYTVELAGSFDGGQDFRGPGYGGAYRFDTSPLYIGTDDEADVTITVYLDYPEYTFVSLGDSAARADARPELLESEHTFAAHWPASTRNQMIVATQFPSKSIATDWGEIEVYAAEDQIDAAQDYEYVTAVGEIISFYTELWGDPLTGMEADSGEEGLTRQPVFLIPEESGVQAFEDAGMVFILGGERTGIPLMAHEVAHLWWGHGVDAPRWFVEGMANYGAAKFMEHYYGAGGPADGEGDPLSYRRYVMKLALGNDVPMPMLQRDRIGDEAAIYHNSAGFLLTADARLPYGLDGMLMNMYEAALWQPAISHDELRAIFADYGEGELAALWDSYIEDGMIPAQETEEETWRELVHTPGRDIDTEHLSWLMPAYRKKAMGDYAGALYMALRAQEFRNEDKDKVFIGELLRLNGEAEPAGEILRDVNSSAENNADALRAAFSLAKLDRDLGNTEAEKTWLTLVAAEGIAAGLYAEANAATERLAELGS